MDHRVQVLNPLARRLGARALLLTAIAAAHVAPTVIASAEAAPRERRQASPAAAAPITGYEQRAEVRAFVAELVSRHGFDEAALLRTFEQTRGSTTVIKLMQPAPPGFRRSWTAYRARFLDPLRMREGARFWDRHAAALERAAQRWGVPPEFIVAIIGVETIYGRMMGDFRVMDALTTLAFDYPRRAAFFREELEHFLLHARDEGADPFTFRGSFAGAIGIPQFMPGSIRRWAVDFDGDGHIDLRGNPVDAIGSVANFLAGHGWAPGGPTHWVAQVESDERASELADAGIEPRFLPLELAAAGISADGALPTDLPVAVIRLPNGDDAPTWFLGAPNFYVITRYNRSSFYAMAVIELAQALRAARR